METIIYECINLIILCVYNVHSNKIMIAIIININVLLLEHFSLISSLNEYINDVSTTLIFIFP